MGFKLSLEKVKDDKIIIFCCDFFFLWLLGEHPSQISQPWPCSVSCSPGWRGGCVTGVHEAAGGFGQVLKSRSTELTSITSQCNWINREIVVFIFWRLSSSACAAVCDCVKALRTALIGIFELNSLLKTNKTKPTQRFPCSLPSRNWEPAVLCLVKTQCHLVQRAQHLQDLLLFCRTQMLVTLFTFRVLVGGRNFFF